MDKLRLRFTKTGRAVYISHLDLMRTMQRAFLRSEIPLKYSEGFNPHAQISFALPLSVGTASECELMDFRLREYMALPEIVFRLNRSLPEGIKVLEAYEWDRKTKEIKWLDVDGVFEYDVNSPEKLLPQIIDFYQRDSIVIEKKSKNGVSQLDIAPAIRSISLDAVSNSITLKALVSAREPTLNPDHMVAALRQLAPGLAPDFACFRRIGVYDGNMQPFR